MTITHPFARVPAFELARARVKRGELGQLLGVYAVARGEVGDPLVELGLPILRELVECIEARPSCVTAIANGDASIWTIVLAFESGVRATIDLARSPNDLVVRLEWSGAASAIIVEPGRVAVTVSNATGTSRRSGETRPVADELRRFASDLGGEVRSLRDDPDWATAVEVVDGARSSSQSMAPVSLISLEQD